MFVCWSHMVKYKLAVDSTFATGNAPCELCGCLDGDWSVKVLHRENDLQAARFREQIAGRTEAGEVCCGTCSDHEGSDPCSCERCACAHEKWRWHRLCEHCTPLAYAQELPNEIDTRPLTMTDEEKRSLSQPNYYDELVKHRAEKQHIVTWKR